MAVLNILKFPDSRLRSKCAPVKEITDNLVRLADDMLETMYSSNGLGLSAIQVGHFVRLLTADTRALYNMENERYSNGNERCESAQPGQHEKSVTQPFVLFNPEILSRSGEIIFKEGCLSFPSYYAEVKRANLIEVRGLDKSGKICQIKTDGVLAVCIQHEIDHLNGKLFIDHLSPVKADRLRAQIKKYGYPDPIREQAPSSEKQEELL